MASLFSRVLVIALVALGAATAAAQSGSGSAPPPQRFAPPAPGSAQRPPAPAGSGSVGPASPALPVALGGYCAICLSEDRQWIAGQQQFAVDFDGKRYLFPGAEKQQRFRADPIRFAPALGGDDVVEFARAGRRTVGQLPLGAAYQGRFYFFASDANKQAFLAAPAQFANADLALGGACVVCRVDSNAQVAGDPGIATVYRGVRYQFPAEEQRQTFLANPARYVNAALQRAAPAGSGARGSAPQGAGAAGSGGYPPRGGAGAGVQPGYGGSGGGSGSR